MCIRDRPVEILYRWLLWRDTAPDSESAHSIVSNRQGFSYAQKEVVTQMASRMRLLPRSMKLEKSSRTSDLLWRMSARSSCRWLPLLLPMRTPMSPWWARRSSTVRLSPVRWGSRQRIRKIVSAVQQFVDKLNSMDWISKRRSCPWYYIGECDIIGLTKKNYDN